MTTWRYVITRDRNDEGYFYEIRELYTGPDGKLSWTTDPINPFGETLAEIQESLTRMASASLGHVLDISVDPPIWRNPIDVRRIDRHADA